MKATFVAIVENNSLEELMQVSSAFEGKSMIEDLAAKYLNRPLTDEERDDSEDYLEIQCGERSFCVIEMMVSDIV
jgi:hypothetical protein